VVEDALEDKDPNVRLRASAQLLDRVLRRQQRGASVNVVVGEIAPPVQASAAEVIGQRLGALREAQQRPAPSTEPEALPWDGGREPGPIAERRDDMPSAAEATGSVQVLLLAGGCLAPERKRQGLGAARG
jgi:hypothetical protein